MSTSGVTSYSLNAGEIVAQAFGLIHVGREGEPLPAEEFASGMRSLNLMVRTMMGEGYYLWKKVDAILFAIAGQAAYRIGAGGDRCVSSYSETRLADNLAAAAVSVSVASVAGMANGQIIGVLLDSGIYHWTTINGTPTVGDVPLTAALPGAASAGNSVISYTSTITRPLRIIDMQRRDSSGIDVPMFKMAREDYRSLTNKTASGSAVQWYYDPKRGTGVLYLWQPPADERNTYRFTAYVPLEAFTASTDDPDCPDEWVETLIYNLAVRLLPYWGSSVASDEKQIIIQTALALKQTLRGWDEDDAGISFQPMPNYAG